MNTLARRIQRGFTLIEILVALALIGIILGLAVVKLGQSDAQVSEHEARRLAAVLEDARDEAIAGGRTIGWSTDGHGYQFWVQDDQNNWQAIPNHEVLKPYELPENLRVTKQTANLRDLRLGERIVFEASGVNQPFTVEMTLGQSEWMLEGDVMGRVNAHVVQPDA
ncbi:MULTISPECIES: type II secretion system minor pseudopilin GspH [Silvimonas]|uniref:type II secretion system minor pseudopilin GspH n=1 Tax=Silvimonas TaxID=300264 RepID=UPI0024B36985|nr:MULTISPECIES: type II secretion system minor pseudopilin GspH [Silvimonas]MDR3428588.1 type II secretion system minor pseudopilin GspH [Silvimonas sp.]